MSDSSDITWTPKPAMEEANRNLGPGSSNKKVNGIKSAMPIYVNYEKKV